jgi:hypothetical protein
MTNVNRLLRAATLLAVVLSTVVAEPISLHPKNPHYYFLFRGKAIALITSAEHYGAVMNLDFDYHRYLATLEADGLNYTRLFGGKLSRASREIIRNRAKRFSACAGSIPGTLGSQRTPRVTRKAETSSTSTAGIKLSLNDSATSCQTQQGEASSSR